MTSSTDTSAQMNDQAQIPGVSDNPARSSQAFLAQLLTSQCRAGPAQAGVILRIGQGDPEQVNIHVLCACPALQADQPVWWFKKAVNLARALEGMQSRFEPIQTTSSTGSSFSLPGGGLQENDRQYGLFLVPLQGGGDESGGAFRDIEVFLLEVTGSAQLARSQATLELTSQLAGRYELERAVARRDEDLDQFRRSLKVLAAANEPHLYKAAAMTWCNELAAAWDCPRAALGFVRGRHVYLEALSHTEKLKRKMALAQAIETAMDECFDQDIEILFPAAGNDTSINRAAGELSKEQGGHCVYLFPIRRDGQMTGVLCLEREGEKPLSVSQLTALRLVCDISAPGLVLWRDRNRWFGMRWATSARKGLATVIGAEYTWVKLAALALCVVIAVLIFVPETDYVDADFVLQPVRQRVISAPFDGYLASVKVKPSDQVVAGRSVLATLDTSKLQLQLSKSIADRISDLKKSHLAARERKTAQAQIARAKADAQLAQINLLKYKINHARIVAPISGVVLTGDLRRKVGEPVKLGQKLFVLSLLGAMRAKLQVPESRIDAIRIGQKGLLASKATPGKYWPIVVTYISPIAKVIQNHNVFVVRCRLPQDASGLAPGTKGLARLNAGQASIGWVWTRSLVNWVRMYFWW